MRKVPAQTPPRLRPSERRPVRQIEATIAEVVRETPHAVTLVLSTGTEELDYRAGQFLTIDPHQFESLQSLIALLEEAKGRRETPRAYSMSSTPDEPRIAITVKDEHAPSGAARYPPLLSPFLVHEVGPGAGLLVRGFSGHYTLPDDVESVTDHLVHISAGSGSVPNFSILKFALRHRPGLGQTFIYSNRSWREVIFRRQLARLAEEFSPRLRLVHTLTRERAGPGAGAGVRFGRVDAGLVREVVPDLSAALFFVCGPANSRWDRAAAAARGTEPAPRFMEAVLSALTSLGVPEERIVKESYG